MPAGECVLPSPSSSVALNAAGALETRLCGGAWRAAFRPLEAVLFFRFGCIFNPSPFLSAIRAFNKPLRPELTTAC